jgi:Secretion system C-terminal sorting domain/Ig-like domain CHU_C associated
MKLTLTYLSIFLLVFYQNQLSAQCPPNNPPNAGPDININCGNSTNLSAVPIYNVSFTVSSAACPGLPTGGTNAFPATCDDCITGQVPIGFPFNFFGNTYTTAVIQSNGIVGFGAFTFTGFSSFAIPSGGNPNNYIAGLYTDIDIRYGGTINYQTLGTAPNRQFVVSYNNVVPYNGGSSAGPGTASFQIILNENGSFSTRISQYSANWSATTSGVLATQGCENLTGTVAVATPGRNSQDFRGIVATNPSCNTFTPVNCTFLRWQQGGTVISTLPTTSVSPNTTLTYTSFWACPSGTCTDDLVVNVAGVTTTIAPSMTTICNTQSVTITATGASSYNWSNGANTSVITVSPSSTTIYRVTGTTAGCTSTASTTITVNNLSITCPSNVTVAECNAVVTFATPSVVDVCAGCVQRPLSTILSNFNTNGVAITSTISNRFNFTLDGTNGATGTNISDGGSDMYDGGNTLNTNIATAIPYTAGVVTPNSNFGVGGSYFTQKVDNMFILAADINGISSFSISGNNGADGSGTASGFVFSITVGCQTYNVFVKQVSGASDPSINHIIIIPANAAASHTFATNTDDDAQTLSGITASTRLYYLLVSGTSGYLYTNAEIQNMTRAFLTQVSAATGGTGIATVTQTLGLPSGSNFPVGTNNITFRATSAIGVSVTCSSIIQVNPTNIPAITGTNSICNGQTTTLTASGGTSYLWSSGQNTAAISVSPAVSTTYTATTTDGNGCTATANRTVTVNALPISAITGINSICNGQPTTLTASGGTSYLWSSGQNTAAISVSPAVNTTYTATTTDGNGCTATANRTVTVNALPTATITGVFTVCNNSNTTLTASGGTSYLWSSGQNTASINISPIATTTYTVTTTNINSCTATTSQSVSVNTSSTVPSLPIIPASRCPNTSVTLAATGGTTGTGSNLVWYSGVAGSGTLLGTGANLTVSPASTTTYYVRREGTCNTTTDASVLIDVKVYIYALNGTNTNTYCTDDLGWQHFFTGNEIILSVQGSIAGAAVGFPLATIYDNGTFRQNPAINPAAVCSGGFTPGEERFEMARAWNFDMGGAGVVPPYNVRFYHRPSERAAIETAAINWMSTYASCSYSYKYAVPLGFYWFKNTVGAYVAPQFDGLHLTGTVGTTAGGINYAQYAGVNSFSGGSGSVILVPNALLPLSYTYFKGEDKGDYNQLTWETTAELNNAKFEVERSVDGINFEYIGEKTGAGTSNQVHNYSFDDSNRWIGLNYYRLRQVDFDGNSSLSNTIVLYNGTNEKGYLFYPNPTQNSVNYQFTTTQIDEVTVEIIDVLGRKLITKNYSVAAGSNNLLIDMSNLIAGTYVIRATHLNSQTIHSKSMVKISE